MDARSKARYLAHREEPKPKTAPLPYSEISRRAYVKRYKLTEAEHTALKEAQRNLCAICKNPEFVLKRNGKVAELSIDHCHTSGKIRGLLCRNCNAALGQFRDSIDLLEQAKRYLEHAI